MDEIVLYEADVLLEKFSGKGGWTFARIDTVAPDRTNPFGWLQVKGFVDDFELQNYKLMPMGDGKLFLPVRAEIRKKIKKEAGDWVHIVLYTDSTERAVPAWILACFAEDPDAEKVFQSLKKTEQNALIDWILAVKKEENQIERVAEVMKRLAKGLKSIGKEKRR